ncbi:sugar transferase (plasmid) [Pseudohalocynthiibacter aestuariivivens]|uniref:Sugar transferase n=1 Tax=Roseovarius pelagicus TaxID=2980108 RepID=A0ABY6D895_9RHOB|nr:MULTISPECIES: sugar transferase [Rhodobacterales]QIE47914.1 sugar transferase [Pseudohalocynthiibacter aestuariivivens]UXX81408.1 sugar transferase [Roseovarius pelagicus]
MPLRETTNPLPSDIATYRPADTLMRITDLILALGLFAVTAIPMLVIAILIRVEDRGPILFRQPRVGRNRARFSIAKFRTMTHDTSRFIGGTGGENISAEDRAQFQTTVPGDTRITRIGRVLRPLHLDELPQVLNVLKGDMSLVGVRPDVPVMQADYTQEEWILRHMLRPGITGLAQIDPSVDSMAARTAQDLEWVQNRSYGMYLRILLGTVKKVVKRNSL